MPAVPPYRDRGDSTKLPRWKGQAAGLAFLDPIHLMFCPVVQALLSGNWPALPYIQIAGNLNRFKAPAYRQQRPLHRLPAGTDTDPSPTPRGQAALPLGPSKLAAPIP